MMTRIYKIGSETWGPLSRKKICVGPKNVKITGQIPDNFATRNVIAIISETKQDTVEVQSLLRMRTKLGELWYKTEKNSTGVSSGPTRVFAWVTFRSLQLRTSLLWSCMQSRLKYCILVVVRKLSLT